MQISGVFVRFDPVALPNTRQTTNEQVWLIRTSKTPGGVERDPRFSLRGPTATIMLPIGNADDEVLVGDALLVDRGKVDAQPTPLSRWKSLQQALTNWQAARSLTTDAVNDHPDVDLVLALDSRVIDDEWRWPKEVTFHHLVRVVAAIAVLPWYDFSRQLIEDVLDRWDEDKEVVQLEPEALETLRLACSLIALDEQAMLLLSFARQSLSVLVNTPSSRWTLFPAAGNTFIVFGSAAFKVMRGDGKVTTGQSWDKVRGILVFTVESEALALPFARTMASRDSICRLFNCPTCIRRCRPTTLVRSRPPSRRYSDRKKGAPIIEVSLRTVAWRRPRRTLRPVEAAPG